MAERPVSDEALAVLSQSQLLADRVILPARWGSGTRLPDALYAEVHEIFVRLGGKWKGGKTQAHLFPNDPRPLIAEVIASGIMPPRNPTAFFPTPPELIGRIMASPLLEKVEDGARILEPSAGSGALAEALRAYFAQRDVTIECCELHPLNRRILQAKGFSLVPEADFLAYRPAQKFHLIVMNPPFTIERNVFAYIDHIEHAWELLEDDGVLIAIAPLGFTFRSDRRSYDFLSHVLTYGYFEKNPPGSFKASSTMVETVTIHLQKEDVSWRARPHLGYPSWCCWQADLAAEHNSPLYRELKGKILAQLEQGNLPPDPHAPALKAAIRAYYDVVIRDLRETGTHVELTETDWSYLAQETLNEWREERDTPDAEDEEDSDRGVIEIGAQPALEVGGSIHAAPASAYRRAQSRKKRGSAAPASRYVQYPLF